MTYTGYHERTLVLLKTDTVQRGLIGEVIGRFEKKGLKITAMKMVWPTEQQAKDHYYWSEEEKRGSGERTIAGYKEKGIEIDKDPIEIAEGTQRKLYNFMTTGPVVAMIIEGAHAIASVRKIRGATNPLSADVGSLSADFAMDSYEVADEADRAIRNIAHASGNTEEAEREIQIWFEEDEIMDYDLAIEKVLYSKKWESVDRKSFKRETE